MDGISMEENCRFCWNSAQFFCYGCEILFCSSHADEHRQSLNEQLDWFTVDHDDFLSQLTVASTLANKSDSFHSIIDRWERQSIHDIRQMANEARQALIDARQMHLKEVKEKFNVLTHKIHQAYEQKNIFDERTIQHWSKKLRELQEEFLHSPPFSVRIHGNKPVVMPVIKLQSDPSNEHFLEENRTKPIGLVSVDEHPTNRSFQCLCNRTLSPRASSLRTFNEDLFHICTDHARICDTGQLVVHDASQCDASVRGLREYSQGEHKLIFRLERISADRWIFFGIISKQTQFDQRAYLTSSAYGWAGSQTIYANGKLLSNRHETQFDFHAENSVELTIDCQRRSISLRHGTTDGKAKLTVDLQHCPFPWQFLITLRNSHDSLRILPLSNLRQEQDRSKNNGLV